MAQQEIKIDWINKMAFKAEVNGHEIMLDATPEAGGENHGPRPKPLMMVALAGCTGMDVVAILKKMRVEVESYAVRVVGDLTDEHPKHYFKMHIVHEFKGKNLPMEKLWKAVNLSEERYCGVGFSYRKVMEITTEIKIIE